MEEDSSNLFNRFNLDQPSYEEQSLPQPSMIKITSKNENITQELNTLNIAKQRFRGFLDELGDLKKTPIRQDVLSYCGAQKKSQKIIETNIRPESILKKIETRIDKMQKTRRIKRNWGHEDLKILLWIISKYSDLHHYVDLEKDITDQDWNVVASYIPGVTPEGCMFKWLSIKKITLATYKWMDNESNLLEKIVVAKIGKKGGDGAIKDWKQISQELYRLNQDGDKVYRNAKQCKEHWNCHLNPELKKGLWQLDEDIKLLKFIRDNKGLKKWAELAKHFDGRTENALKNRHKLIIQKLSKQAKNKHKDELQLISEYLQKLMFEQLTSNVRIEQSNFFEDNQESSELVSCQGPSNTPQNAEQLTTKKKQQFNQDTNDVAITPARVQKFNMVNFRNMNFHFLRNIQPGIIESDGTFKKMSQNPSFNSLNNTYEAQDSSKGSARKSNGPFTIIPLQSVDKPFNWS